jgi:hypothetical protein
MIKPLQGDGKGGHVDMDYVTMQGISSCGRIAYYRSTILAPGTGRKAHGKIFIVAQGAREKTAFLKD